MLLGVVLLFAGMYFKFRVADSEGTGLIVAGCIILGVWLTETIIEWTDSRHGNSVGDTDSHAISEDDDVPRD